MIRASQGVRSPVKREGAERYLLLSLISFAISVIFTRLFLQVTGYPQLGNGQLHIAHVLWGGLLLFIASLLPLILANRWALNTSAILSGVGVGLFIDEVGKFITQSNDYFYPPAAPIIYAFFLITVLLYLTIRRRTPPEPRSEFYLILDDLTEILDHDLDPDERADLEQRLYVVASSTEDINLQHLAVSLANYLKGEHLLLVKPRVTTIQRLGKQISRMVEKVMTRPRLKIFLISTLGGMGVIAMIEFGLLLLALPSHQRGIEALILPMVTRGELHSARDALWFIVRTILEGGTGIFLIVAGGMLSVGHDRRGIRLATMTLVIWLTVINLLVFYLDQFSAIITAMFQFVIFLALTYYQRKYLQTSPPQI
ncbi:MAG: hypothetical protein IH586_03795, partial [Anaerolineaceae bacterium]|nr:hypothetical protein [Anaerolineaceae bacterium]